MNYVNEFGLINDSDLRSSVTIKKRPKSSINTSNKKSKTKRENDLFSTFHMKEKTNPQMIKNSGTEENLSNDPIY